MEKIELKELVYQVIKKNESSMTVIQIQKGCWYEAIVALTGTTSIGIKDIRQAVEKLIEEQKIQHIQKETKLNLFKAK
jgi:hypothetical protein